MCILISYIGTYVISKDTGNICKGMYQTVSGGRRNRVWREEWQFSILFMSELTEFVATSTYCLKNIFFKSCTFKKEDDLPLSHLSDHSLLLFFS